MKIKDDKKYWDKIEEVVNSSLAGFKYCLENNESYYKQQMMYFKAKAEAYERMLVKAKLITSDKERIIKFGDNK